MTTFDYDLRRMGCYLGEGDPLNIVNAEIIVASGEGVLYPGQILGQIPGGTPTVTPGTPVSGSGQTVGNGAVGAWTGDANVAAGGWQIVITNEAANLGSFKVIKPDGSIDGYGTVGSAYNGGINGTLADGSNDWKEDDVIPMTVAYSAAPKYVAHDNSLSNGGQNAVAILFNKVDATSADTKAVATVRGNRTINGNDLIFKVGISNANKLAAKNALRAKGLSVLPQHADDVS